MKLQQLHEASYHGRPKRLNTETGTAELHLNGEMVLDNSGYETRLLKKEVEQIWNGAKKINRGRSWATFDGQYWIFDEAMHIVPEEWKFEDTEFHSVYEARLALSEPNLREAITQKIIDFIANGKPSDAFGDNRGYDWFYMNEKNQVGFIHSGNNAFEFVRAVYKNMGVSDEEFADSDRDPDGYIRNTADLIIRKVMSSPKIIKLKNRFKGNYAASGEMAKKLKLRVGRLDDEIEEREIKRNRLLSQLKKIQK